MSQGCQSGPVGELPAELLGGDSRVVRLAANLDCVLKQSAARCLKTSPRSNCRSARRREQDGGGERDDKPYENDR